MDGYGKRILVVDDDAGGRSLLVEQLEQEGYAVQTAGDGLTGLEKTRWRHFDAVIANCRMPGLSGVEFLEFSNIVWPDTPVILLAGDLTYWADYGGEFDRAVCIRKPYEATLLLSVLRSVTASILADHEAWSVADEAWSVAEMRS